MVKDFFDNLSDAVHQHLKYSLPACDLNQEFVSDSSDEELEVWENVDLHEIEDDIHQGNTYDLHDHNVSNTVDGDSNRSGYIHVVLVIWFCIFLCMLQANFGLTDTVLDHVLHFKSAFLSVVGEHFTTT